MADRAVWVAQAFRRYHAGQITLGQLLAMVRAHRNPDSERTGTDGA